MHLVRDVLDKQLMDHLGRKIGRVDGIIVEIGDRGSRPRVTFLDSGCVTQALRIHPKLAQWTETLCRRIGANASYRIPWKEIKIDGLDVRTPVHGDEMPLMRMERYLSGKLKRLPGGAPDRG